MDNQDEIKYLDILEQALTDELTETQAETKSVIDNIREKLQKLRALPPQP